MFKILWKSLLVTPAIVGAALAVSSAASATEARQTETSTFDVTEILSEVESTEGFEVAQTLPDGTQNDDILNQLDNYSSEGQLNTNDQVTSVNELRDVQPTDWAYEALRSLVERYGCIVGYPDRTYRGDRALSRWEFAAGLNACMNVMERLIQENVSVLKEDVDKLKRLMQEFEAELAALGARVDNLEGRVSFLEDHQFSTTTKLQGEVIFGLTDTFGEDDDTQTVFGDRVRLTLNTSFTGEDRLVTRLAAGNLNDFDDLDGAGGSTAQTFNLGNTGGNDVVIDWLAYYFPINVGENFKINTYVAATGGIWSDIAPTTNPYFEDYDGGNGALSTFASENPIYRIGGGAGAAVSFQLGLLESVLGPSTFTFGYLSGSSESNPADPALGNGLFNGDYAALGQLNFNIGDRVALGLTYVHGFHKAGSAIFDLGGSSEGVVGTEFANLLPTGVGVDVVTNSYGAELAFRISDRINFSSFFTYTNAIALGVDDADIWTYGGGFSFPDLGKEGNLLGIFAGVQPYLGDTFGGVVDNQNPVHIEAFYKYQVNDNISITPGVIWISNPNQGENDEDAIIGTIRTTFTF